MVNANAHCQIALFAGVQNRLELPIDCLELLLNLGSRVIYRSVPALAKNEQTWVDAYLVNVPGDLYSDIASLMMHICHQRNIHVFLFKFGFYLAKAPGLGKVWRGNAHNFRSGLMHGNNLIYSSVHVVCLFCDHRLHNDRVASAYVNARFRLAYPHSPGFAALIGHLWQGHNSANSLQSNCQCEHKKYSTTGGPGAGNSAGATQHVGS